MMTDWYRNAEWSPAIAEDFEARLARSRSQKAQYLTLQGMALVPTHPEVAAALLQRAVAMDDPFDTMRALATLAQARLALGQVEEALEAYEAALERQVAQPNIVSVQPADYLFVIGYFRVESRLPMKSGLLAAIMRPRPASSGVTRPSSSAWVTCPFSMRSTFSASMP